MLLRALTLSQALTLVPDHPLTTPLTSCTSPGALNNDEQKLATAVLARKKLGGSADFDSRAGLQYALDKCIPLRMLVGHICQYFGGCRG